MRGIGRLVRFRVSRTSRGSTNTTFLVKPMATVPGPLIAQGGTVELFRLDGSSLGDDANWKWTSVRGICSSFAVACW